MAVSKRTRFEVLRRDQHTCQYCGEMAPNVVLHVDHVEPVSLGGSDKPDNLVTACKACNTGKASIAPGSPLVQALGAKAAAYALGMTDKLTRMRASIEEGDDYAESFREVWQGWTFAGQTVPLAIDWESTLHRWYRMGIPLRLVQLAVPKAMALAFPNGADGRFKYLCGIVWNQVDESGIDYSLTDATVKVYTEYESGEQVAEAYRVGSEKGHAWGRLTVQADRLWAGRNDILTNIIDGTTTAEVDRMRAA